MTQVRFDLPDLVIPISTQVSNTITAGIKNAGGFVFTAPAAQPDVVTIEVSHDEGTTFGTLETAGADITLDAGKVVRVVEGGWDQMRLASNGAVAAGRTFKVSGIDKF